MDYSELNTELWRPIILVGIIASITLFANVIRQKISFIRKSYMHKTYIVGRHMSTYYI